MHPRGSTKTVAPALAVFAIGAVLATGCANIDAATDSNTDDSAGDDIAVKAAADSNDAADALDLLDQLPVQPEQEVDYDRDEWHPSWRVIPGNDDHCNVRQYSLKHEGTFVDAGGDRHDQARVDDECEPYDEDDPALDGGYNEWTSPYDGDTTRDSSTFDADHFIPLEEAARSGGTDWSQDKKHEFAMYTPSEIVIVSAQSNRAKGSDDPADWMPSRDSYHCTYNSRWVQLKHDWDLTLDQDEHDALHDTLSTCAEQ